VPWPFAFYVFSSATEEPTEEEVESGVYLLEEGDARVLSPLLAPLYASHAIGICPSDDEIIGGREKLEALQAAVRRARAEIANKPETWPEVVGHRDFDFENPKAAIVRVASRARLLEFLERAEMFTTQALETGGFVQWGGGG